VVLGLYPGDCVQSVVHVSEAELDGIQPALYPMEALQDEQRQKQQPDIGRQL
jgi:hypothetical protein